ncbi:MAG: sulfite exporter TauE/SafE family protein [Granulosicoccus sp.]|nr:sulfite exporter TauE/SafE family protein [Granulosicoccus sp.]
MEQHTIISVLSLGFSLGLIHALDADHIMAVSLLSSRTRHLRNKVAIVLTTLGYCFKWALGHSLILLTAGALLAIYGIQLPENLQLVAEKLVGVFLVAMGLIIAWQFWRNRIQLKVHQHGDISHVHLVEHNQRVHSHKPVLIGMVHGLAGSAPVLAILPLLGGNQVSVGMLYLTLFSIGVMISMMIFGLLFGRLQHWFTRFGDRAFQVARLTLGLASIVFGGYWLFA